MKRFNTITNIGLIIAILALLAGPFAQVANAAAITSASDTMSSSKVSALSNHDILFTTPTGITTSQTVTVTFPADFSIATLLDWTDVDVLIQGVQQTLGATGGATTWTAVRTSATVLTITAQTGGTPAAAGNTVRIRIGTNATSQSTGVRQVTNPTTTGSKVIAIGGTFADSGNITVQIITDDQVAVSSTVAQTLTFSLGANTLALGTLSSTAVVSGSHTVTVATNAASGMVLTVAGATLTSGAFTITACATGCTSTTGSEQFGINLVANTTPVVGAAVSGTAPIGAAATNYNTANTFRFATGETIASAAAGINSSVFTVSYITNISGATEAGSYTATLTYTATATF